ncbi:hypothetical protein MAUB_18160 [Mycolicibacterium aubagnense]|uniref:Uncharacterized protein n=1 Tax=Mycolicibacterium aubagnense TaxID=319707 RepID=A0ABM7IAK5_9MYCO|nr:hypothetical protein MAUB_18160 [Mycolicibacterium aubagnense]
MPLLMKNVTTRPPSVMSVWAAFRTSRSSVVSSPVVIAIIGARGFGAVFGVAASDVKVFVPKFPVALAGWAANTEATGAAAAG